MSIAHPPGLVLNVVPVTFSCEEMEIGRLGSVDAQAFDDLRDAHWRTHAFRYDARSGEILNVALAPDVAPLGRRDHVLVREHLLLAAHAVQRAILIWIASGRPVLKGTKHLVFWGQADDALLLTQALTKAGLAPIDGLEVPLRYEIDCRMFRDPCNVPYLGLVIGVETANVIDIPVAELVRRGLVVTGRYVCRRREPNHPYLHPNLDALGRVQTLDRGRLLLTDAEGETEVDVGSAFLEPRLENLHAVIEATCGAQAAAVLRHLQALRRPVVSAPGQLNQINTTLARLKRRPFAMADGVAVRLGDPLIVGEDIFPPIVTTERPMLLYGPQGRNTGLYPDLGIRTWGPYMYMQHHRNAPLIAVICEARHRGRVEQFVGTLRDGFPDELWTGSGENPYQGGLIGKFRLSGVRLDYEECASPTAGDYRAAVRRLLGRLPETPDLALVQIREDFLGLRGDANPYFVAKAACMAAGVPVQAVRIEKMDAPATQLAYLLNNVALASYAKLDGTPWVMSTLGPSTHELVMGIGATEVGTGRLSDRRRYVGITTVFQGDGRYLLWGQTREVPFEEYPTALLDSLRATIRYVQAHNSWLPGDRVRLVCHVYKRLKDSEVEAIKTLVRELVADTYYVEFAFLDLSWGHPYRLIDPSQRGKPYRAGGRTLMKGVGLPERGTCVQLDPWRALLYLTGPGDVKTEEQGLPRPLQVELHPDSDLTDMTYLLRQVYHFTYTSWRGFLPATEPVTIKYSRLVATLLGNLQAVSGWDSTVLTAGSLRDRRWFL